MTTLIESDHDISTASQNNLVTLLSVNILGLDIRASCGVAPSNNYAVVTRSRADEASACILVDRDGNEILEIEEADLSGLIDDWRWPEPVKTVAADGETGIYGLVFRPSDFNPQKSYPVISHVFNANEAPFVAKGSFGNASVLNWIYLDAAALAELGFIVVQFDGRGTPCRSKAFHDYSYGNYHKASELEDHVVGIKQLAERFPYMDLDRVGVYSCTGSDGGALGVLQHPEFYKVGVNGDCLHDTRLESAQLVGDMYDGLYGKTGPDYPLIEEQAEKLCGKLLLIHGMLNTMAPPTTTFRLAQALMDANKDFDMIMMPKMGHAFFPDYLMRRVWDYLVEHLLGATPPKEFHLRCGEAWSDVGIETEE